MQTYGFTTDITDEATGFIIAHDVDCRIGVSVDMSQPSRFLIESIELECVVTYPHCKKYDSKRQYMHILGHRDAFYNLLAQRIEAYALADEDFVERVHEGEQIAVPAPYAHSTINHNQTGVSRGRAA